MKTLNIRTILQVVIDNGILQVTLSNPEGIVTGVRYNSLDNVLEVLDNENQRGYAVILFLLF